MCSNFSNNFIVFHNKIFLTLLLMFHVSICLFQWMSLLYFVILFFDGKIALQPISDVVNMLLENMLTVKILATPEEVLGTQTGISWRGFQGGNTRGSWGITEYTRKKIPEETGAGQKLPSHILKKSLTSFLTLSIRDYHTFQTYPPLLWN